tara:strand:+ start:70 stop:393 length:324 start_codon:yes stop_codon:yes gene_type:complete
MKNEIKKLTESYIKAFNDNDIDELSLLVDNDVVLIDPSNKIEGKMNLINFLKNLFDSNSISFSSKLLISEGDISVVHFDLQVNQDNLSGVDIIKWKNGKIISLIAYL